MSSATESVLSDMDLQRLTFWKWHYMLEGLGFTSYQIDALMFVAWRYAMNQMEGSA